MLTGQVEEWRQRLRRYRHASPSRWQEVAGAPAAQTAAEDDTQGSEEGLQASAAEGVFKI